MTEPTVVELIEKKRDGLELSKSDMKQFVRGCCDDSWRDYQVSAMLMAIYLRGLSAQETADLTMEMAASGDQFDLSDLAGIKVDKHSTGGVADTTTLIAAPLAASCGVPVFKVSGRGLGFTGGTIDKLESIPGFDPQRTQDQARKQVAAIGLAILSQTDRLTPADRKLYALRDVTATIDHIPLIAASIMSKKIAAGADAIVLDVKCGSGAFMRTRQDAGELARTMVDIGRLVGRRVCALITAMDQPLGSHIGNSLEVIEAIEVLKGHVRGDLLEVSLELAADMLILGEVADDRMQALDQLRQAIDNGHALDKFRQLIQAQGGNSDVIDHYQLFKQPSVTIELIAKQRGYITSMQTDRIGKAFVAAGGGRYKKEDRIDPSAGIVMYKRLNENVQIGEAIARIQSDSRLKAEAACQLLEQSLIIETEPAEPQPVILERIEST